MLDTLDDPITSGLSDYAYDSAGRVVTRTDTGAGLTWTRAYESDTGRVDTQSIKKGTTTLVSSDLAYDLSGNVTSRTQSVNGASDSWTYAYDPAGRMTSATLSGGSTTTYAYDGGGNRTSVKVGTAAAVTTTYDAASLPVSSSDGTTYTHDEVGNLTLVNRTGTTSDWAFSYDSWSRMSCAKQSTTCGTGTTNISYAYDGLSRVTTRTKGTSATSYRYRGTGEDFSRTTAGGTTTDYTYTPGGPLAQKVGSTKRIYLRDLHSDVVGLTTTAGAVKGTRAFDPWGVPRTSSGESAAVGFQGDPQDFTDTGLVDMVSRYYLPSLGRFTTRDPLLGELSDPITLNQFVYGGSSPVTFFDPTGLSRMCEGCDRAQRQALIEHESCARGGGTDCESYLEGVDWSGASVDAPSPAVVPPAPPIPPPSLESLPARLAGSEGRWDVGSWNRGEDEKTRSPGDDVPSDCGPFDLTCGPDEGGVDTETMIFLAGATELTWVTEWARQQCRKGGYGGCNWLIPLEAAEIGAIACTAYDLVQPGNSRDHCWPRDDHEDDEEQPGAGWA